MTFSAIFAHSYGMGLFDSFDNTVKTPVLSQPALRAMRSSAAQTRLATVLGWKHLRIRISSIGLAASSGAKICHGMRDSIGPHSKP
jgi:hypothetical protein